MKIEFFSDSFKYGQRNSNDDFFQNTLNGVQNTLRVFQNILRVSQNTLRVLQNILRVSQNTLRVF
jgi:ribosomal protein S8